MNQKYMMIEEVISQVSSKAEDFGMFSAICRMEECGLINEKTRDWLLELQAQGLFRPNSNTPEFRASLKNDYDAIDKLCQMFGVKKEED